MRQLEMSEIAHVSGGSDFECFYPMPPYLNDDYWSEQLLAYKTGLSSVFGTNPDMQGDIPPPPA